ncbi:MAG: phosphoglucosamine mutase [Ilumatobacteraceae bacterium]
MQDHAQPRFGTDGVRGRAIVEITPEFCMSLGRAVAQVLRPERLVIAHDPRLSGPILEAAFAAGAAAEGVEVQQLGMLPTPAVAVIAAREGVPGVVVTASHNGYSDNGIKVFAVGGSKVSDADQQTIESRLRSPSFERVAAPAGRLVRRQDAEAIYAEHITGLFPPVALEGLRIVIDTANGAMSEVAPRILESLGADVIVMNNSPDGTNINDRCGATAPQALCEFVANIAASTHDGGLAVDLAFAFDGDGDRLIAVDERGRIVDGDRLIALSALDRRHRGQLLGDGVVVTVMTNLGFHRAMKAADIDVVTTPVGDRAVLEAMALHGYVLGGEQSGHIIHRDLATTGDGLLAAIELARMYRQRHRETGEPFSVMAAAVMQTFPQVLSNVPVGSRTVDPARDLASAIAAAEAELGSDGRVLVRTSGTESLIRIMVEASTEEHARQVADRLSAAVRAHYG